MASFNARWLYQYKYQYKTLISTKFDKQNEDNQILIEIETFINLNNIQKLTESDND